MAFAARGPEEGAFYRTVFVIAALSSGALVWLIYRCEAPSTRAVLLWAMLFRLLLLPLPPTLSDDGYRYVWDGMLVAQEGINPYRYRPSDPALSSLHDEPIYSRLNSASYYSIYPPISQLFFAGAGALYPLGWAWSWYAVKGGILLVELGGLWLLSRLVSGRALLLYAWHPLILVEVAGQAHTEALVVLPLLLTFWAVRRGRGGVAAAALTVAGWVKLIPLLLLPFMLRRVGWRWLGVSALVSVAVVVPFAAPYVLPHWRASLDLYVRLFEFNAGPYYALKGMLSIVTGEDVSKALGPALQLLFIAGTLALFRWDRTRKARVEQALFTGWALFLVTATTVHPWYLIPLVAILPLLEYNMPWLWLSTLSMATYLRYAGPSWGYAAAVSLGWGGWGLLILTGPHPLAWLMRRRARAKWDRVAPSLGPLKAGARLLDLGAGDGYVGERASEAVGASVTLVDVVDFNQTRLPLIRYDGRSLPFPPNHFDGTLLLYVLHHADDPSGVLQEAGRVTRGRIVILESVFNTSFQRWALYRLDRIANRLRSGGAMENQEPFLHFRDAPSWHAMMKAAGLTVLYEEKFGSLIHSQALFVVERRP